MTITVTVSDFGKFENVPVHKYTVKSSTGFEFAVIEFGACLISVLHGDRHGIYDDVVLGYDDINQYFDNPEHMGAGSSGRVANRIRNAEFELDGVLYHLDRNNNGNMLHGGGRNSSWNWRMWEGKV